MTSTIYWSHDAEFDLNCALQFAAGHSVRAGEKLLKTVSDAITMLEDFSSAGRPGRVFGTREFVLEKYPFILIYRFADSGLEIVRLLHTSRKWPSQ